MQRKPDCEQTIIRWPPESTIKRFPCASSVTSVGFDRVSDAVPAVSTTNSPISDPGENFRTLSLRESATNNRKDSSTWIPRGPFSWRPIDPLVPSPAAIDVVFPLGLFNLCLITRCFSEREQ